MIKRIQNKYAEGRLTLQFTLLYGIAVWLLASFLQHQPLWLSGCCMVLSVFAMIELNDNNLLIRIYSRSVSSVYIVLVCACPFLFSSVPGMLMQLCFIAALGLLFQAYQDKQSAGWIFYAFACLSICSIVDIRLLFYVPLFWFIMLFYTYGMSKRTFISSLLGIAAPYWFLIPIYAIFNNGDITRWTDHLKALTEIQFNTDYSILTTPRILFFLLIIICYVTGAIHFLRKKSNDKIRVRQIYFCLILITAYTFILTAFQPSLFDMSIRLMIITVSPLIAHFISLTHTKFTNIGSLLLAGATITLTIINLWILSSAS